MKAKLRTMLLSCLALLLVLGMTSVACAYDVSFSDVPEDSWFYTDVMTLAESGVIGGYPDGTYRPTKKVTTGEALKMILLAAGYPEPEPAGPAPRPPAWRSPRRRRAAAQADRSRRRPR